MTQQEMELYGLTTLKALKTNDWESSFPVFEKLERDGLSEASLALGQQYSIIDDDISLKHFKIGADRGCAECAWSVAAVLGHEYIPNIIGDDLNWFKYCLQASRGACGDAMNELGNVCYHRGETLGMFYWYSKAALCGHPGAANSVKGVINDWIIAGLPKIETFVLGLNESGASQAKIAFEVSVGRRKISSNLVMELMPAFLVGTDDFLPLIVGGLLKEYEIDDGMAKTCYQIAAHNYSPICMRRLAYMLADGKGCEQDLTKALSWFSTAAAAGDRVSQFEVGQALRNQAPNLAAYWYMAAHRRGYAQAMPMLMELCP